MIFAPINGKSEMEFLPKAARDTFEYIKTLNLDEMDPGPHEVPGYTRDEAFVNIMDLETRPFEEASPEIHKKYIDIQYLPAGNEIIGFAFDTGNNKVRADITDPETMLNEKDILFYEDAEEESRIYCTQDTVMVLFPWEAHRPACIGKTQAKIRKAVGKVNVDLLFK